MDWDDLRLFLAVARSGKLAHAARLAGMDPTTIGRRLGRLERALATTLFEKAPSGHVLTEHGRALLPHAEQMEAAAIALRTAQGDRDGILSGIIRISVSEGFGSQIVAPALPSFLRQHPDVDVQLVASSGFLNPSRREADVAIMLARPKAGPLITRRLTNYRLGLYATQPYTEAMPRIRQTGDLLDHRLVGYVDDLIYAPELRYIPELQSSLRASVCSTSIVAQAELIKAGAGCGILPCFIGDRSPGLIRVIPDQVDIRRSFWLVVHRDVRRIARIERFIEWLDNIIGDLRGVLRGQPCCDLSDVAST